MGGVKMKGRNVEDATNAALEVLQASRDEVEVKVLNEGKGGVLGVFGGEEAEVEVSLKEGVSEKAQRLLQEILDKAGFVTMVTATKEEGERVYLEVKGEDLGRIIGREGATLDALQRLVSSILSRSAKKRKYISIDAASYRKKRASKLRRVAEEAIQEALDKGKEVSLPPMTPRERREVHLAVKEDGRASSHSSGEGAARKVVISPEKGREDAEESA